MIELVFVTGGHIRKVYIKDRVITFLVAELDFVPFMIDLNKVNSPEIQQKLDKFKNPEETKSILKELSELHSEDEIIRDIKNDFQSKGWRLVKIRR